MKAFRFAILFVLALVLAAPFTGHAQFAPSNIGTSVYPVASFTATAQTSTTFGVGGAAYGVLTVTGVPLTPAVAAPTIVASGTSTYSTATYATVGNSDTISGTLKLTVTGGTPFTVTIPAGTTLSGAVTLLNANTTFNSTNSLTASTTTSALVITGGAYGTGGTKTIIDNTSTLTDTEPISVVFATQGSGNNGGAFTPLNMAVITAAGTLATTETFTAAATAPTVATLYIVNLDALTNVKFVTSSTFTAASISITLTTSNIKGLI
jgi:hypothetical protein